jgi:hypothetical protein
MAACSSWCGVPRERGSHCVIAASTSWPACLLKGAIACTVNGLVRGWVPAAPHATLLSLLRLPTVQCTLRVVVLSYCACLVVGSTEGAGHSALLWLLQLHSGGLLNAVAVAGCNVGSAVLAGSEVLAFPA